METALDILFDKKAEKYKELESKTKFMRQTFTKKTSKKMPVQNESEFALIPSGRALIKRFKKNTDNAQKSINLITTSERFLHSCSPYVNSTKKTLLRHVECRLIIEEPDGTPLRTKEHLNSMWKGTSMKIRHISAIPFVIMIIFDKKEVYISAKSTLSMEGSPYLWP